MTYEENRRMRQKRNNKHNKDKVKLIEMEQKIINQEKEEIAEETKYW